ncbi:uncharacterized protein LOC128878931 [Hylaeus volcanicus]|uniref:uncharacterized protein LOC128878931 n=1 Tax=Hylaeus volcanicus TaxID=313075 RepID=UPI0023B7D7DE|nr:uncharacterized protein LOC128878931 [Hylaeus volcanicus]
MLSLKEQCNRLNYVEKCISRNDTIRKTPCNAKICKPCKKFACRNTRLNKVQTDLTDEKTTNTYVKSNTISQDSLAIKENQSKSDQIDMSLQSFKSYVNDKQIDTFEEKNEQTIPTKDNFHAELSTNTSNINNAQHKTGSSKEKIQPVVDKDIMQNVNELKEVYSIKDIPVNEKKMLERIQKDLSNERKRTEELEKKLENLTCSMKCLQEDSEQKADCLKSALKTAEEQTKRAMDLAKRSSDQTDLVKSDRNELLKEITRLQQQIVEATQANTTLKLERDDLKNKLDSLTEDESKRY